MKFDGSEEFSSDIEDRRRRPGGRTAAIGGGGISIVAILGILLSQFLGGGGADVGAILEQVSQQAAQPASQGESLDDEVAELTEQEQFIDFVVVNVQDFWTEQFAASNNTYARSTLVLYVGGTDTAGCGYGQAASGPFYCPADQKMYLDLSFFDQLDQRFGAPGDFAQAYVIAHEVAHHVQNLLGISSQVRSQQQADPDAANDLSVRLELQADCLSGVWAYSVYDADLLEQGDLEEGIRAAEAVGDDAIQASAGAPVNPETWTHGSSDQRVQWFNTGFESGDPNLCDTFSGSL